MNRSLLFSTPCFSMGDDQSAGTVIFTANNEPRDDSAPAWYNLTLAVAPAGKMLTMWVRVKQVDRFPKCQQEGIFMNITNTMTRIEGYIVALLLLLAVLYDTDCAVFTDPYGMSPGRIIEEVIEDMPIVEAQVLIAADNPREVFVWVMGEVGGSCTEHHNTGLAQKGNTITIKITRLTTIREGVGCTQEARFYYETVYLGTLPAGDYKISVNDVEKQLRINYGEF